MRLTTSHGTYVVVAHNGGLLHIQGQSDQYFQSVWSETPPPAPAGGSVEAAINEGPLARSTMIVLAEGFVAFRRDGLYLCADPRWPELRFDRHEVGDWERFTITPTDGAMAVQGRNGLAAKSPNLLKPVLFETAAGYQLMVPGANSVVWVTAAEFSKSAINRYTMLDGSWIVDADSAPDPDQPYLVYWFYPYSANIHVWQLDQFGRRTFAYDLSPGEARLFLLDRCALGPTYTARLYMLSQIIGDWGAAGLLSSELIAAAEAGSTEALYALLQQPLSHPQATVRRLAARAFQALYAANRARAGKMDGHLKTFEISALASTLQQLEPTLRGLSRDQLQVELDFQEAFTNSDQLPTVDCALPKVLSHRTVEGLTSMLRGPVTSQTLGVLLRRYPRTVEFHYIHSAGGIGMRMTGGVRYAYYIISTHQDHIWGQLTKRDGACEAWTVRFEVGDLPTTDRPSVVLQRQLGDSTFALIPDLLYFDHWGFQRGWFADDIPPWSEKETRFVWRGSTTGGWDLTRDTVSHAPRVRLCELGRGVGSVADFGVTDIVQARSRADAEDIGTKLRKRGILRERMPQHVMGKYKFLIEIDGNANSWGFLPKLMMGCCVLKVQSPFEQWYYDQLEPWVHYIPVAEDLSDLTKKIGWALDHEDACKTIASEGCRLAESLTFDKEMKVAASKFVSLATPFLGFPSEPVD